MTDRTWENSTKRKKIKGPQLDGPGSGFGEGGLGNKPPKVGGGGKNAYTVKAGDSAAKIAQAMYGDQRYFNVIQKLIGGATLQPGMVLKLPDLSRYQQDLSASGQKHLVTPGEASFAGMGSANYSQPNPTQPQTPGTQQVDPMATWLANNPAQTGTPYVVNPPPNYAAASGVPPVGYGPNAWTPKPKATTPQPPINYAALAARGTPAPRPLNPNGSFNLAALPSYQRPAISSGRRATQPSQKLQQQPPPPPPPPTQLTGIAPLQGNNPAKPGAATGYYTGIGLQPYPAAVRTGASLGSSQAGRPLPSETIKRMDKPIDPLQLPWLEQGPPPPLGWPGNPQPPLPGEPYYPYPYPTGGGGPRRGGGGGGGDPRTGFSRGAGNRPYQPIYAQSSSAPQGGRNPSRDVGGLSRSQLVAWRL